MKQVICYFVCGLLTQLTWADTSPSLTSEDKGYKQMVIGFTLASTASYALHNYYAYYQRCPRDIAELNLPDVSEFADSPLASISLDKACQLHINYKEDDTLAAGLRGKTIILQEILAPNIEHFVGSCRFNGATRYAPNTNCELTPAQQQALTSEVWARGEWFSKLYNEQGAIPTLKGPMNEAVLLIFDQKKSLTHYYDQQAKCPVNNQALGIANANQSTGYYVESITISGCDIVAKIKSQANIFPELRGKELILRLLPTPQKGHYQWQCGSNADQQFLPVKCQSK